MSFRAVLGERALLEAQQAEARLKGGEERPLLGVPIALKDNHGLAGELTCNGTDAYPDPAPADDEMVRRLREAGAIVIGKTHLPELAICGFTESVTWGVSRNPWNAQHSPGRIERRQRRRSCRRNGGDRLGLRRGRLDPHPRFVMRPLRHQATARPRLAGARTSNTGTASRPTAA